ncbi:hypothetical protein AURDEDRAFT_36933, partial [Auricularia subglabra TFB-10046 SS5]
WVILCGFLKLEGYELRARYQPDWVPSWAKIKHPTPLTWKYEDGEYPKHCLIDAIRVSDGTRVMLKLVKPAEDHSEEIDCFLTARGADPRNHCLPLLAVLRPPEYPGYAVLVAPYCLPWMLWPFVRVDEAVDFFTQVFEASTSVLHSPCFKSTSQGLAFMHENNVAHLDASHGNIVMDAVHLYQEPFHPMRPLTRPYGTRPAQHLERHQSQKPVRYYFIDFEGSLHFDGSTRPLVTRQIGQDKTVPEECDPDAGPCDPFAVDVYCLGNVLVEDWLGVRSSFVQRMRGTCSPPRLQAYKNVEFIRDLAEAMTAKDPAQRPTAAEVVRRFEAIRDSLPASQLQQAL